jgi:hypothetical protein
MPTKMDTSNQIIIKGDVFCSQLTFNGTISDFCNRLIRDPIKRWTLQFDEPTAGCGVTRPNFTWPIFF